MTTAQAGREPDILELVTRDVGRDAAARTRSPYVAAGRLGGNLGPPVGTTRRARHTPARAARSLAGHFDVPSTHADVAAAVDRHAHALLERVHAKADPIAGPTTVDPTVTGARRLRDSTDPHHRTPPDRPQPRAAWSR